MPRLDDLSPQGRQLFEQLTVICRDVVGPAAADVDAQARFPSEAIEALRAGGFLGALVPAEWGGPGCTYADISAFCTELGKWCGNAAMVFGMHQIQVACIVQHGPGVPHFEQLLRELVSPGRLLASATTEVGTGGDLGSSICAVEYDGDRFTLEKQANVISYGDHVDDILVTARRTADSPASDQVILHAQRPDLQLEPSDYGWDTLGMRGTCSVGFVLKATGSVDQIVSKPYAVVSNRTMQPVTHIFWSSLWLGLAESAVAKARAFVRNLARKNPGVIPPNAPLLSTTYAKLEQIRFTIDAAIAEYERARRDPDLFGTMAFTIHMNNLKMSVSRDVVSVILDSLTITGLSGYRNDGPYSLVRELRDALSAPLMVHNDRIITNNAFLLCAMKEG